MWLNPQKITADAIEKYRKQLLSASPKHLVIDDLFNPLPLNQILEQLTQDSAWQTQRHTYDDLYVDDSQWQTASQENRFVQRDCWQRPEISHKNSADGSPQTLLSYLRSEEFMALLSQIFSVTITDIHVEDPDINTNFFRLNADDFVELHADDSPGREICMLLYLNKNWPQNCGGDLVFAGTSNQPLSIAPLFNRCVLFDPSSEGSEHWVKRLNPEPSEQEKNQYRYNITSWYWSE